MNADVEKAVEAVRTALFDWAVTHAPEFSASDSVAAARKRTSNEGTLAYISDALASMDAVKKALRDQEAEIAAVRESYQRACALAAQMRERAEQADALLRECLQCTAVSMHPATLNRITTHLGGENVE